MVSFSNITAGLVLGLVVTSAIPARSPRNTPRHPRPQRPSAGQSKQCVGDEGGVSPDRAQRASRVQ